MKHYVEYLFPGIMMSEAGSRKQLSERTISAARGEQPKGAVAFRFFSTADELSDEKIAELDSLGYSATPKPLNETGWHYTVGEKLNLPNVAQRYGVNSILYQNMQSNGWDYVLALPNGQVFQLYEKDTVL